MHIQQIIPRIKIANQSPILEMVEDDQAFPAGMWRWRVQGDIAILERALDTFWTAEEGWVAYDKGNEVSRFIKAIATQDGGELTIAVGVITATVTKHSVDTEAGAATDQLDTINGAGYIGQLLILGSEDDARDIILRDYNDSGGNIACGGAGATVVLQNVVDRVMLQWDGTYWCVIADSISNAASGSATFSVAAVDSLNPGRADYQCDGVADEVEINAALNALPAAVGGRVILMEGTFTIADPIVIPVNNITLRGQGRSSFIDGDGLATNEHAIVINAVTNITIKNLAIQTEDGGTKTCHCIDLSNGCNGFTVECVTIVATDVNGINIHGTNILNGVIREVSIEQADEFGIYCDMLAGNNMLRIHVLDCFITGCGNDGIRLYLADYSLVTGNVCYVNGNAGIFIVNTNYIAISNNICVGNTLEGIHFLTVTNSTVDDNICYLNTSHNIYIGAGSDHNVVKGNECIEANSATSDGIEVDNTANENSIIGNTCISSGRYGIYIAGAHNKVTENHITLSGDDGIWITAADCQISDNYIYDNGQDTAGTYHGIVLSANADRCQVSGNIINDPGDATEDGIHLEDGVEGCQIDGNKIYNLMGSGICLVDNNHHTEVTNNHIEDVDDHAIEATGSDYCQFNGNQCDNPGGRGIRVVTFSRWCTINDNNVSSPGSHCIEVNGSCTYATITGNNCSNVAGELFGILLTGNSEYATVSGNNCYNTGCGIYVEQSDHSAITGNNCSGNHYIGICLDDAPNCTITGNVCNDNDSGGTEYAGIDLSGADYTSVTGNLCDGNGLHGIHIKSSDYCSITANVCTNSNTGDRINVTGAAGATCHHNTISSNTCTGNADDGIAIEGGANADSNIVTSNQCTGNGGTSLVNNGANTDLGHNKT